jgi:hypothetical protein
MAIGVAAIHASRTRSISAHVVIVHPMPLMRFGLRAALAGLASAVAEFANAGEARQTIN